MAKRRIWRWILWIAGILAVLVLLVVLFVYSGIYNVAAISRDSAPVAWLLETVSDRSIERRAARIQVPPLNDPAMIQAGLNSYQRMCIGCHGAPGVELANFAKGLNPRPPEMVEEAEELEANEIFWVTKNGIRMTGMPAFGVTTSDETIWAITAFVETLPDLTPEEFQALQRQNPPMRRP